MPQLPSPRSLSQVLARPSWTAEDARQIFASWASSSRPLSTFAREHGVDPRRLYWWRGRLRQLNVPVNPQPAPQVSFCEVTVAPAPRSAPGELLEVVLPSGMVVRVGRAFEETTLRRLLAVLAERHS